MAINALDNTSRGQPEIQAPSSQSLNMTSISGGERNVQKMSATMSVMDNISTSSMHLFPDLEIYHDHCSGAPSDSSTVNTQPRSDVQPPQASPADSRCASPAPTDSTATTPTSPNDTSTPRTSTDLPASTAPADSTTPRTQNSPSDSTCSPAPTDATTPRTTNAPTDTTAPTTPASAVAPADRCDAPAPTDAAPATGKPCTDANPTSTDATKTPNDAATTQPGDQSWQSHVNDKWVQDSLKEHPDWHAMEGLHPGEVAVGNWDPTKEEKKVIGSAVDQMIAQHNDGPCFVTLPDGSLCTIEITRGGHGQSFSKGKDNQDTGVPKHRKISYGRPASDDDSDAEVCGNETDETSANPMSQVQVA